MSLSARLRSRQQAAIGAADRDGLLVPSFSQQRLWFLARLEGASEAYHSPLGLRLKGVLDEAALIRALETVIARHEALRTVFYTLDGELYQRIKPVDSSFAIHRSDLRGAENLQAELSDLIREEVSASFDLEHGPLIRSRLIYIAQNEHVLLVTMHHIVSDGWSAGVLRRELSALYKAYSLGQADPLVPLLIQYADYAAWQRQRLSGEALTEQSAYWQRKLLNAPTLLELPMDRIRPSQQDFSGSTVRVELNETVTEGLEALSRRHGLTLFMTVLAGWALVLSRLSNQEDVVIGVPSANRGRLEIEGLIGFFVNTLALRIDLSGAPSVSELLDRVKTAVLEAQIHQDLPFEQVVDLVKPVRSLSHTPLFQVMFAWQNNEGGTFDLPGLEVRGVGYGEQPAKFDLTLDLRETGGRIVGGLNYATSLFDQKTVERYAGYLREALSGMVADTQQVAAAVPLLSEAERHKLLVEWNATDTDYPKDLCIHQLFEAQVAANPAATAVVYEGQSLSYGDLNTRANRLAHHLIDLGVRPDSRVAICVERSLEMVIGLVAILKAGGAYVPLDPAYPAERLGYMLKDSAPVLILTHAAARSSLDAALAQSHEQISDPLGMAYKNLKPYSTPQDLPVPIIDLQNDANDWAIQPNTNPDPDTVGLTSRHLAYVIYTSGSTGQPKGVMIEHKSVVNYLEWAGQSYGVCDGIGAPINTSYAFDATVTSFWVVLVSGRLVKLLPEGDSELSAVVELLRRKDNYSLLKLTPSHLDILQRQQGLRDESARAFIIGGESLSVHQLAFWREQTPRIRLINEYGPTEATVGMVVYEVTDTSVLQYSATVPIGRPISNTRIYLLDGLLNPVPEGVSGEIYIGGAGVARGYLNRPDLTGERFIESPFVSGDRLYKTGDLGRYLPDGNIEFLGRNDFQVKIRGFRIELGEIEARLLSHPGVREAVVIAREDETGDKRLVGYYTAASIVSEESGRDFGVVELSSEDLRSHLSSVLPDYMVPAAYVRLEALPLTPNGKLDRKALPAPEADAYGRGEYEAPIGPVETALARIWSEVLGIERVGRRDNFFELGGHSLLAIRVLERMRQAGLKSDVRTLFTAPVLSDLAVEVEDVGSIIESSIGAVDRDGLLVPSFAQQRLWFLARLEGVSEAYHVPLGLRLKGVLDEAALIRALETVIARHEALRTVFYTLDGELYQRIKPVDSSFAIHRSDLRGAENLQAELSDLIREEVSASFDLEHGPLIRSRLIYIAQNEHVLLVTMHHIVSDGWSAGVLRRELSALYKAYSLGQADPLVPLLIQYADYAAWQRQRLSGEALTEQSAYWQRKLLNAPTLLELPMDRIRPSQQDFSGSTVRVELNETVTEGLEALSRRHGLTLFMTVLAGWALVLSRLSNQEDVVIGVPSANRGRLEIEGLIGFFVNTLALRIDLSGAPSVSELLDRVKTAVLEAQIHQDLPFEQVVDLVKPVRSLSHTPLFQVMFAWQNNEGGTFDLPGLEVRGVGYGEQPAKFDLTLDLRETGGRIVGGLNYATSLFDQKTVERYAGYLREALSGMVADTQQVAAAVPLLSEAERHKLLVEWNATDTDYPKDLCIHQLFEAQVAANPAATAVVYEGQSLSYGDLNTRANRLAHHLIDLGVRPDSRVAICVERSLEMMIGLVAILKAGGAYVPLDPAYPAERLGYMLKDSAPVLILTHAAARSSLDAALAQSHEQISDPLGMAYKNLKPYSTPQDLPVPIIDLQNDANDWAIQPNTNPDPDTVGLTSRHLAYVIYTSGSTGQPKGVMIEHSNVARLFSATQAWFRFDHHDTWTLFHSFAFDFSVWEIWGALLYGGKLIVVPQIITRSPHEFYQLLCAQGVTILNQTPSAFRGLIIAQANSKNIHRLKNVIFGGESLDVTTLAPWYQNKQNRKTRLVNMYGITETTVHVTYHPLDSADIERTTSGSPIGSCIPDLRIYLLDGLLNPVPEGVSGEIYIGGAGVARGYLNRPDLTGERFIESPFVSGDRLYKTGDLGRYLPDGNIEFLGRNDFQVKIRGFRIELGEIEARLLSHPGVREAVVIAREDETGDKRLVGYYTAASIVSEESGRDFGVVELSSEDLRSHLSSVLPDYMVPAAYVRLEALPLTPNGKLDRKALPAPEADAYGRGEYEAPIGPVETALARIWSEVLGIERVGRRDNFFELGGHSLLAIRVLERMRQAGLKSDVRTLFTAPVLSDLAVEVEDVGSIIESSIGAVDRDGLLVPSFAQQRLWFLARLEGVSEAYHVPLGLRLKGVLDEAALIRALETVIARHEALRTVFYTLDGELYQRIKPVDSSFAIHRSDLRGAENLQAELSDLIREEVSASFDLEHGPLIRSRLIYIAQNEHVLLVTMHHIVSDGWSAGVLRRELSALYKAYSLGQADPLVPLLIQYADYAAWQRQRLSGEALTEQSAYWQRKLLNAPTLLELPMDRIRPSQQDFSGSTVRVELNETVTEGLEALSRRHGLTLFMTVLAGWALVLSRLSNQEDVVIGVPSANRGRLEIEGLIGFFVNTLALRIDLSGAPSVSELLDRVKTAVLEAQIHQDLPFEQVVDLVKPVRSLSHTPLFQVMFAWQNNEGGTFDLPGLEVRGVGYGEQPAKFDLTLDLRETGGRIVGGLNYATSLFDQKTVERYAGYLREALSGMVADTQQVAAAVPLLSEAERHKLLVEWNATDTDYPKDLCIHQLFEAQVAANPAATAVVYEGQSLSYGDLNTRANRLAHHLIDLGVRPDSRVAICVERSLEMMIGLVAILKAGGAYVPLDPAYPAERLGYMLKDSAPVLILTHAAARSSLDAALAQSHEQISDPLGMAIKNLKPYSTPQDLPVPIIDLQNDANDWAIQPNTNPDPDTVGLTSRHLAYVIYTSGSTGQPKGVMIEHKSVVNYLEWAGQSYGVCDGIGAPINTSYAFDATVTSFWVVLVSGRLVKLLPEGDSELSAVVELLRRKDNYSLLKLTPSHLDILQRQQGLRDESARAFIIGGESLSVHQLAFWREQTPRIRLINEYGPTEATVGMVVYEVTDTSVLQYSATVPIGRPISNTRIYLLDGLLNPVPEGVSGEIYIGGAGVARGYLNRPDLTGERFIESPFVSGDRLYKTGDLGRYLPDGNIEFLGRNDFQVKIRGFRIELGEIEARLLSHPGVREAVVIAREDETGDKRLVGYYTAASIVSEESGRDFGVVELSSEDLRSHLSSVLPDYMVPAAYVRLEALPLTPNGKLDRKALPAPEADAYGRGEYEAPIGPVETALARIWSEVLGIERVGRRDNFFELGGHSLLAIRVLERMRQAGLKSDVRTLFTAPVLSDLAVEVEDVGNLIDVPANRIEVGCEAITPDLLPLVTLTQDQIDQIVATVSGGSPNVQDIYPLAPLQEGILFHHLMTEKGDPYLLWSQASFADRGKLDSYILALNAVIARHDILRTAVVWEGLPEPVQVVWRNAPVTVEEVSLDPAEGDIASQLKNRFDPRHCRLDVRRAPLLRLYVTHDPVLGRWVMMQTLHHLSSDHTTLEVMRAEVRAHMAGQAATLPRALPFRNFVTQARLGISREEHEAFFHKMLGDIDEPTAAFGLTNVQGDGSGVEEARLMLATDLAKRLRSRARVLGVSAASIFHVAWGLVLARASGQQDCVFGTVLFGRMQGGQGADRILGLFINTLPVRIHLGSTGAEQSVLQTHALLAELLHHEHASLALAQRSSGVLPPAPLFTALLNYRHNAPLSERRTTKSNVFEGIKYLASEERTNYPITLSVDDLGKEFELIAQTVAPLDPKRVCAMMSCALEQLIEALETKPERPVGRLDVLPPTERHKLLVEWNATDTDYPKDLCIHQLFEAQVAANPAATAVVYEGQSLSYGDLNTRANRLAHHLIDLGVRPDSRVAICVERSLEMMIGLVAILKAGGAYVPLDPAYPAERLGYMLKDSAPVLILTHAVARSSLDAALAQSHEQISDPLGMAYKNLKPYSTPQDLPVPIIDLQNDANDWAIQPNTNPDPDTVGLTSRHLAYVIYTSGSTGQPKGVMIEHKSVVNYFYSLNTIIKIDRKDRIGALTTISFDISVTEVFYGLSRGAIIDVISSDTGKDPNLLAQFVVSRGISVLQATPATWKMLDATLGPHRGLKALIGGETLTNTLAMSLSRKCDYLWNMYGPTETTVWSAWTPIKKEVLSSFVEASSPPIGRPISNTRIYLLDGLLNPVPEGVSGEIYIGGAGVARGYLNRPDLTGERFIESPFVSGDRLYKTGDLGRYLPDGNIEFLGRNDFQVKIRGFRIELGEIEARLLSHPGVREAVVIAREDETGDKRLVGYYTAASIVSEESGRDFGVVELSSEDLRSHLSSVLPDYMVPAAYVRLEALPLTPNGKLDRKALPAPEADAYGRGEYEAPIGPVETALARIWSEVLGIERVGRRDNFFELGGHSLLAIRVLSKTRQLLETEFSPSMIFTTSSFFEFVEKVLLEIERQLDEGNG